VQRSGTSRQLLQTLHAIPTHSHALKPAPNHPEHGKQGRLSFREVTPVRKAELGSLLLLLLLLLDTGEPLRLLMGA
jgi:hypothetical protein